MDEDLLASNKLGITDLKTLREAERDLALLRETQLAIDPVEGAFDLAHLQSLHGHLFQDVYPWAGTVRDVQIAKENSLFCLPAFIESEGNRVFAELHQEDCLVGLSEEGFAERAAYYLGELNALHPFREGNGRATRAFFAQLAEGAGHSLDWSRVSEVANREASIAAMVGDHGPFAAMLRTALAGRPEQAQASNRTADFTAVQTALRADAVSVLGDGASVFAAQGGAYRGEIVGESHGFLLQQVAAKTLIAHVRDALDQAPTPGTRVEIKGRAVTSLAAQAPDHEQEQDLSR